MTNSGLFLAAFADGENDKQKASEGKPQGLEAREQLFLQTFGQPAKEALPEPHMGQNWRLNLAKVSKLSFTEKYALSDFEGVPYRQLPAWIIDGGYAIASQDETKYQKKAFSETGLNQTERNQVFNAAKADAEALVAMTQSELLRDSDVLDGEIASLSSKYGAELMGLLNEVDPEAASYINARKKTKEAEARAAKETISQEQIAAEIKSAQEALGLQHLSANQVDSVIRGSEAE